MSQDQVSREAAGQLPPADPPGPPLAAAAQASRGQPGVRPGLHRPHADRQVDGRQGVGDAGHQAVPADTDASRRQGNNAAYELHKLLLLLFAGPPLRPGDLRGHEGLQGRRRQGEGVPPLSQHGEDEHDGEESLSADIRRQ